jgi:hypothetical protein
MPNENVFLDDRGGPCSDPDPQPQPQPQSSPCTALDELLSCIQNYLEVTYHVEPKGQNIIPGESFQVTIAIKNMAPISSGVVFIDPTLNLEDTEYAEVVPLKPGPLAPRARLYPGRSWVYIRSMKAKKETNSTTSVCKVSASAKIDIETLFRVSKSSWVDTIILPD